MMQSTAHEDEPGGIVEPRRRIAFRVAYDGTDYRGWQRQPGGRTVQGTLEAMLTRLAGDVHVGVIGAGRTDSGVHARAQVAHADITTAMSDASLLHSLRRMSPPDVAVEELVTVEESFHARYTACRRSYRYTIITRADPFLARYAWHIDTPVDVDALRESSTALVGRHDFTALSKHNPDTPNPVCEIEIAEWSAHGDVISFDVVADRFLYGMVRMLVGIQLDVARGRRAFTDIRDAIASRNRATQSQAAPAQGLALVGVGYPLGGPFVDRTC